MSLDWRDLVKGGLPPNAGRFVTGYTEGYPVRLDWSLKSHQGRRTAWYKLPNFDPITLWRAFGLDPNRFRFDLPASMRSINTGSTRQGFGEHTKKMRINGFIFQDGIDEPVGVLTLIDESDKFSGKDPTTQADFEDLSKS